MTRLPLQSLDGDHYDVVVIGAGAVGCAAARQLAARYPLWQIPFRPFDMWQRLRYTRQVMRCRAELVEDMPDHLTRHRFHGWLEGATGLPAPQRAAGCQRGRMS
ncbi:hypothetical protein HP546_19375 [Pseudomonas sp. CM25]|uniref:hypothetical protein n=1 Tax=Pseudomonas sp. CM25 TaxID=2738448 RepID=UPI0015519692|nr:hypothetical protein [Pseudomonas sp. CM25]NQD57502.1 hypothetical protein [Pseudomonas sp. CM25]